MVSPELVPRTAPGIYLNMVSSELCGVPRTFAPSSLVRKVQRMGGKIFTIVVLITIFAAMTSTTSNAKVVAGEFLQDLKYSKVPLHKNSECKSLKPSLTRNARNFEESKIWYEKIDKSTCGANIGFYFELGTFVYAATQNFEKSLELASHALGHDPENIDVLLLQGFSAFALKKTKLGLQSFTHILKLEPDNLHARLLRGLTYLTKNYCKPASRDFLILLQRKNLDQLERGYVLMGYGRCLAFAGKYQSSLDNLWRSRKILQNDPSLVSQIDIWIALSEKLKKKMSSN